MARRPSNFLPLILSLTFTSAVAQATETVSIEKQRDYYSVAKKALASGQMRSYEQLSQRLKDYPLYGYLEFDYLKKNIHTAPTERIEQFLETYADSPISDRLRYLWLTVLARKGQWQTYLEEYRDGGGVQLRCYQVLAMFRTGDEQAAMESADQLWLNGKAQPAICDTVFSEWNKRGGKTKDKVWARIELAMDARNVSFAKSMAKDLDSSEQKWVPLWIQMSQKPAENLLRKVYYEENPIAQKILRFGIKRLSVRDAGAAADVWDTYRDAHRQTSPEDAAQLDEYVALQAAIQRHPQALQLLARIESPNAKVREWRVRTALTQEDWWSALTWIESLPPEERAREDWKYWRARILEMQSLSLPVLRTAAERIFANLSRERSYHGFLAADRLGRPYQFESDPLQFSEEALAGVMAIPGIARAYELFQLGLKADARREWNFTTSVMNENELHMASVLAHRWGWYDRAILTVAKTEHFDDLDLRFPMAYKDLVMAQSDEQKVDPAWVYGVLRQESTFMADARSSVGALGLMQLMPRTGRMTAAHIKTRIRSTSDLLDVRQNIRLGAAYLKQMLNRYDGHSTLATASYNAGPTRVTQWMPDKSMPADLWVEMIPFSETRNYVRKVMAYTVIYDYRLNGEASQIRQRMPTVTPGKRS